MARTIEREMVQTLRRRGRSIRSIAEETKISKSTVSYWCKNIVLRKAQMQTLLMSAKNGQALGLLRAAEAKRIRRLQDMATEAEKGSREVGAISKRDLFIFGLALYWSEGYKKGSDELGFTNSDPRIIRVFIRWLQVCYGAKTKDMIARVSINAVHEYRALDVLHYWSDVTGMLLRQFSKTSFIRTKLHKNYGNHDTHFGTLRIKLRRGTSIRRRILGSIDAVAKRAAD